MGVMGSFINDDLRCGCAKAITLVMLDGGRRVRSLYLHEGQAHTHSSLRASGL